MFSLKLVAIGEDKSPCVRDFKLIRLIMVIRNGSLSDQLKLQYQQDVGKNKLNNILNNDYVTRYMYSPSQENVSEEGGERYSMKDSYWKVETEEKHS